MKIDTETILAIGLLSNTAIEIIKVFVKAPAIDAKLDQVQDAMHGLTNGIRNLTSTPKK